MSWERAVVDAFNETGVDTVAYLPDSILDDLVALIEADESIEAIRVSREEEAVGILAGAWLGGRRGALICQSSGLANCFNAIGSHVKPAGIPFLGLVTRRGGLGDHNFAQIPAGYNMPRLLDDMGVRNTSLDGSTDVGSSVELAIETTFSTADPYIMLLERELTGGK
ncbi:MAG: thiamine pyrophosphate-binding protein [Halobacteriales archaeon]|nr:thiamine pyrophosphate-binding protein [Halobacteriales archaeon]